MAVTDWTAVNIEPESNEIVKQIQSFEHSPFAGATSIDVLLSAAAYALSHNVSPSREYKRGGDITNKNLITDDQKWFMCMLFYTTDPDSDLSAMEDRTKIVRRFEQYAQAGLPHFFNICKARNSTDTLLQELDKSLLN